jgi:hypothetical protein
MKAVENSVKIIKKHLNSLVEISINGRIDAIEGLKEIDAEILQIFERLKLRRAQP